MLLLWVTTSGGEVLVVLTTNTLEPQELNVCHWKGLSLQTFHTNGVVCKPTRAALMTGRYQQLSGCGVVINANPNNPDNDLGISVEEWTFAYPLVRDKHYTADKFFLQLPTTLNPLQDTKGKGETKAFNLAVNQAPGKSTRSYIIRINRGERNLLAYTVIDPSGTIV